MSRETGMLVRFDEFEVDLETRLLSRAGQLVPLNPRTFDLLAYLIAHPHQLVTREQILEALWPDRFVEEGNLSQHIFLLRKALNESRETARLVRTIPGRGYEFTARMETSDDLVPTSRRDVLSVHATQSMTRVVVEEATEEDVSSRFRMRLLGFAAGALSLLAVLAVAASAIMAWRARHASTVSIAVLPFANHTGDPSKDYVCSGLADELIDRLDRFPVRQLRVVAPELSSIVGKQPASEMAGQLGVQYLLEGSLQQQGAFVRVSAQLVRVRDQARIWSRVYDGDLSDTFAFESGIAESVEHALSLHLPPLAETTYRPEKFAASDAYLKGRYFFSQRSREGFEKAVENFGNAVAVDPHYAAAYAQLASTYNLMGQYSWMDPGNARSLGRAAASQALSLDPTQSEAHAALGFSYWFYDWDPSAAEQEFRRAIALDHASIDAHHWYAQMLMTAGRFGEAEEQMQAAIDIDPLSPILRTNLGWLRYYEGNYPRAIQEIDGVLNGNPDFLSAHYKLWYAYSAMGDRKHAAQEFPWIVHGIADPARERTIQDEYNRNGYDAALRALVADEGSGATGSTVEGARCLVIAGDRAGALALLQRAYQIHEGWTIFVPADPTFTSLRNDSRFQAIAQEIRK